MPRYSLRDLASTTPATTGASGRFSTADLSPDDLAAPTPDEQAIIDASPASTGFSLPLKRPTAPMPAQASEFSVLTDTLGETPLAGLRPQAELAAGMTQGVANTVRGYAGLAETAARNLPGWQTTADAAGIVRRGAGALARELAPAADIGGSIGDRPQQALDPNYQQRMAGQVIGSVAGMGAAGGVGTRIAGQALPRLAAAAPRLAQALGVSGGIGVGESAIEAGNVGADILESPMGTPQQAATGALETGAANLALNVPAGLVGRLMPAPVRRTATGPVASRLRSLVRRGVQAGVEGGTEVGQSVISDLATTGTVNPQGKIDEFLAGAAAGGAFGKLQDTAETKASSAQARENIAASRRAREQSRFLDAPLQQGRGTFSATDLAPVEAPAPAPAPVEAPAPPIETKAPPVAPPAPPVVPRGTDSQVDVTRPTGQSDSQAAPSIPFKAAQDARPGDYATVDPREVQVDPKRFQFKQDTDQTGVTDRARIQGPWNESLAGMLTVWRDPANGQLYVVNGHHRLDAAKKLNAPRVAVRLSTAATADEARIEGALTNIAEDKGTPIDVAKLVRDAGMNRDDLAREGVSPKSVLAKRGLALARLSDPLWIKVTTGDLSEEHGAAIGEAGLTPEGQAALATLIERQTANGRALTPSHIASLAQDVRDAGEVKAQGDQGDIFGILGDDRAQSTAVERAVLRDWLITELGKNKRILGFVTRGDRADVLAQAGNTINVEQSKAGKDAAAQALDVVTQLAHAKGPIADALNAAAARVLNGEKSADVRRDLLAAANDAVAAELGRRSQPPATVDGAGDAGGGAGRDAGAVDLGPVPPAGSGRADAGVDPGAVASPAASLRGLTQDDLGPDEAQPYVPAVGDSVKLQIPGLNGPNNVAGRVTRLMPDGRVEVKTWNNGYHTVDPSRLTQRLPAPVVAPSQPVETVEASAAAPADDSTEQGPLFDQSPGLFAQDEAPAVRKAPEAEAIPDDELRRLIEQHRAKANDTTLSRTQREQAFATVEGLRRELTGRQFSRMGLAPQASASSAPAKARVPAPAKQSGPDLFGGNQTLFEPPVDSRGGSPSRTPFFEPPQSRRRTRTGAPLSAVEVVERLRAIFGEERQTGTLSKALLGPDKTPLGTRAGRMRGRKAYGYYEPDTFLIRLRSGWDLATFTHELGHHLDITALVREAGRRLSLGADKLIERELLDLGAATSTPSYSRAQVRMEGAAEFFRYWFPDPEKAKQLAPNLTAAVEQLMRDFPKVGDQLREAQYWVGQYVAQPQDVRGRAMVRPTASGGALRTARLAGQALVNRDKDPRPVTRRLREALVTGAGGSRESRFGGVRRAAWRRTVEYMLDQHEPIRRAWDDLYSRIPQARRDDLGPARDAYRIARKADKVGRIARAFLEHGVRRANGQFISRGLGEALAPIERAGRLWRSDNPTAPVDFGTYLIALRAREVLGSQRNPGLSSDQVNAILDKIKADPMREAFETARDAVYDYNDALLEYAEEAGLLSVSQKAAIKAAGQFYVPLQRVIDELEAKPSGARAGYAEQGSGVKRLKGSGREVVDPVESIIRNTAIMVAAAERNAVMQSLGTAAALAKGGAHVLVPIEAPKDATTFSLAQVRDQVIRTMKPSIVPMLGQTDPDIIKQMLDDLFDESLFEQLATVFTSSQVGRPNEQIVSYLENGQRRFVQVQDPHLYKAITGLAPIELGVLQRVARLPTALLRAGATMRVPFIVRNFVRDMITATFQGEHGFVPVVDNLRGAIHLVLGSDEAKQFWTSGASGAGLLASDRRQIKVAADMLGKKGARLAGYYVTHPIDALQALSEAIEASPRMGEFLLTLDTAGERRRPGVLGMAQRAAGVVGAKGERWHKAQGRPAFVAQRYAELTDAERAMPVEDFAAKVLEEITGQRAIPREDVLRFLAPYAHGDAKLDTIRRRLKARLQEARDRRSGTDRPAADLMALAGQSAADVTVDFTQGGSVAKQVSTFYEFFNANTRGKARMVETIANDPAAAAINIASLVFVSALLWHLNQDDEDYERLPWRERATYWFLRIPGSDKALAFAKPHEWALVANIVEAALDKTQHENPRAVRDFLEQIAPVSTDPARTLVALLPTFARVLGETAMNYDTYREREIVPAYQKRKDPELQVREWTSDTARLIGKGLNASPARTEHALSSATGGMFYDVARLSDPLARWALGREAPERPAKGANASPITSGLIRDMAPGSSSEPMANFYDRWRLYDQARASVRDYTGARKSERIAQAKAEIPGAAVSLNREGAMVLTHPKLDEAKKLIDRITDDIDEIGQSRTFSPDEKRKRVSGRWRQAAEVAEWALGQRNTHSLMEAR